MDDRSARTISDSGIFPHGMLVGGRYAIERTLGVGAIGTVYLVRDMEDNARHYAMKTLRRDFNTDLVLLQRFFREAELMKTLNHPHVVRVFTMGKDQGRHYFVMEYVEGETLESLLKRGRMPVANIVLLLQQLCSALEAIHNVGIIHRDLKPSNILIDKHGIPKLSDFSVARPVVSNLTKRNEVLGSYSYVAPELVIGKPISPASDLYSLGVMLYELTTGQLPFELDDPAQLSWAHVKKAPPSPLAVAPDLPGWLNRLILRLLSKSPSERPRHVREVMDYVALWSGRGNTKLEENPSGGAVVGLAALTEGVTPDGNSGMSGESMRLESLRRAPTVKTNKTPAIMRGQGLSRTATFNLQQLRRRDRINKSLLIFAFIIVSVIVIYLVVNGPNLLGNANPVTEANSGTSTAPPTGDGVPSSANQPTAGNQMNGVVPVTPAVEAVKGEALNDAKLASEKVALPSKQNPAKQPVQRAKAQKKWVKKSSK